MSASILVVEDDRNQRLLYQAELAAQGYTVFLASDGKQAVRMVECMSFDLIVMDICMPNMDGVEALGRILAKNCGIPIILNTAYVTYKDNFMTWAADAYVVKSSLMKELKDKIAGILGARDEELEQEERKESWRVADSTYSF